ncbi:MAG: prephenate dehydrogenase/arogenate dehydrogenase family protein [Woeseiaceae bacterium]
MPDQPTDIKFEGLDALRNELDDIDQRLVETIALRQNLVAEIGRLKSSHGHQTRDFKRERIVIEKARNAARGAGIDESLAERILTEMIRSSLEKQERDRVVASGAGSGQSALVIGGAGRMGHWFSDFFHSQGYAVSIADPAGDVSQPNVYADWQAAGLDYDVIVVATTLALSGEILTALAERRPRGLVFDVGSLKTPLRDSLERLRSAGVSVTSVHPMFGPSTQLLAGKQVIFVDVGDAGATDTARALFAPTMATCVDMSIDQHDEMISLVLGLSHATNIAFMDAIANSGVDADALLAMSSPTFDAQLSMGQTVVEENPHLYYEIQRLNDFGSRSLDSLSAAVDSLRTSVSEHDESAFAETMQRGREFFKGR